MEKEKIQKEYRISEKYYFDRQIKICKSMKYHNRYIGKTMLSDNIMITQNQNILIQ